MKDFNDEVEARIAENGANRELVEAAHNFMVASTLPKYSYNFSSLGRPIIQYPQDIVAMQEIIWSVKPDLIIETGIAHGGSLIMSASMQALLDVCDAIEAGTTINPCLSHRKVIGVDIDIRAHNRAAIEAHPMASRIEMFQGSSIDPDIVAQVRKAAEGYDRVLVCLDSNHTHEHVLAELNAYSDLTSIGSYCVVFDSMVEDFPAGLINDRPWGPGDNPKTALWEFLKGNDQFEIDYSVQNKLLITVAPDGFLKRIS